MDNSTFQNTLLTKISTTDVPTLYASTSIQNQRQFVVTALLELYKAEALGGGANSHSVHTNLKSLESHVNFVMAALTPQ